jgi:hypothetical protein
MAAPVRTKIDDLSKLDIRPVLRLLPTQLLPTQLLPTLPEASVKARPRRVQGSHRPATRPRFLGSRRVATCVPLVRRRQRVGMFFLIGLVVFLGVLGVGMLAGAMAGDTVPDRTAVVWVQPGETLWQVAERSAPGYDTEAVVARIRELNELYAGGVVAGQALQVPSVP